MEIERLKLIVDGVLAHDDLCDGCKKCGDNGLTCSECLWEASEEIKEMLDARKEEQEAGARV